MHLPPGEHRRTDGQVRTWKQSEPSLPSSLLSDRGRGTSQDGKERIQANRAHLLPGEHRWMNKCRTSVCEFERVGLTTGGLRPSHAPRTEATCEGERSSKREREERKQERYGSWAVAAAHTQHE